jgi:hypothetical protein
MDCGSWRSSGIGRAALVCTLVSRRLELIAVHLGLQFTQLLASAISDIWRWFIGGVLPFIFAILSCAVPVLRESVRALGRTLHATRFRWRLAFVTGSRRPNSNAEQVVVCVLCC